MQRLRWPFVIVAVLLAVAALPAAAVADDEPPVISSASVTPTSLPVTGGTATISADVTDDVGLDRVYAEINGNDSSFQTVDLASQGGTLYRATVSLPPNLTTEQISYGITVWATDTNGSSVDRAAGEVAVTQTPELDEPPIVGETSVTPAALPSGGGLVTIQANAEDHRSVSEVYATVGLPGGGSAQVPMENIGSTTYRGTYLVPPNAGTYVVTVTAIDDIGQPTTESAGTVTVAAPASKGRLKTSPDKLSFGDVRLGERRWRAVEVRNDGRKQDGALAFVAKTSAPFAVVGPDHFTVAPGKKVIVVVEFRPTATGQTKGSLALQRADGGQTNLGVPLKGTGKAARR